ncbi:MAG TPA: hypothetical protein VJ907_02515 [Halanaerobiales bacterium]|nr:hypothetical protein [Halanaerobiales bacterium]
MIKEILDQWGNPTNKWVTINIIPDTKEWDDWVEWYEGERK